MGLHVAGGLTDGAHDHHSPDPLCGCPAHCRARRRRRDRDMAPGRVLTAGRAAAVEDGRGSQPDSGRLARALSRLVV
jgi:hypothetical protein